MTCSSINLVCCSLQKATKDLTHEVVSLLYPNKFFAESSILKLSLERTDCDAYLTKNVLGSKIAASTGKVQEHVRTY